MTTTATAVTFEDVRVGHILKFVRIDRSWAYPGGQAFTITATVTKVTDQTVELVESTGDRYRLTRKTWATTEPRRAA